MRERACQGLYLCPHSGFGNTLPGCRWNGVSGSCAEQERRLPQGRSVCRAAGEVLREGQKKSTVCAGQAVDLKFRFVSDIRSGKSRL
mgnify:FL=1|jgi:hypothetical protein